MPVGGLTYHQDLMAIAQRPLALRRDLIRIFGEDRLVAVIRTSRPDLARAAARAMSEAGVRLVEITLTVPDAFEIIEELALDDAFARRGAIVGAGTVLSGAQAEQALSAGARSYSAIKSKTCCAPARMLAWTVACSASSNICGM